MNAVMKTEAETLRETTGQRGPLVAYFSMEIALQPDIPTYSGGLGVLAGDTIRAAADLGTPLIAVSLLHRKGYFRQKLDATGWQTEEPVEWPVAAHLQEMAPRITLHIERKPVQVRAWRYKVPGRDGFHVPVYLLDTDLPENNAWQRTLTDHLYGGDQAYRLCQEAILGVGGVRMLRALGYQEFGRYHLNEGHAGLLTLELLDEHARQAGRSAIVAEDIAAVRKLCCFTTHTPVAAGHDQFPITLVNKLLEAPEAIRKMGDASSVDYAERVMGSPPAPAHGDDLPYTDGTLNMTLLALNLSHYVNGVAKRHGEVSRLMFAGYTIDAITNGVHAATWTVPAFQALFDRHIPGWREDNYGLRSALSIPMREVWKAHKAAKQDLIDLVQSQTGVTLDLDTLTIGFARRAATYKRADLVFRDLARLRQIARRAGPLQFVFAGKAHPKDNPGKELIQRVHQAAAALGQEIRVVYLPIYDVAVGQVLTAGVDVWLNTPQPPLEASGTSGMKSALNGVPSLSILDGWWIEGCIEGRTGWAIGEHSDAAHAGEDRSAADAASLYEKLEHIIMPMFYSDRDKYTDMMRHAIALNGSFFNTQRMLQQYVAKAYYL